MNRNSDYNIVNKIARNFGYKPKFLYYNINKNKYEWKDISKKYFHPQLIYINGVPATSLINLMRFKMKSTGWGKGIFWCKDKHRKTVLIFVINQDGEYCKDWELKGNRLKIFDDLKQEIIEFAKSRYKEIGDDIYG